MPLGAFTGGVGPYLERLDFPFAGGGQYRHHPARLYEQSPEDSSGRHADPIRPYGSFTAPLPVPGRAFWMKLLRKFPWRYPSSGSAGGRWIGWKSSAGKEPLAFDEKEIQRLLRGKYGVCTERILPARRGFYGETWRAEGPEGAYCIKCDSWGHHQEAYRVSLAAVDFLTAHGIDFVPKVHKMLYGLLARVYRLPAETLSLAREDFGTGVLAEYAALRQNFQAPEEAKYLQERFEPRLLGYAQLLKRFSTLCQGNASGFCLTHGDAGGNCMHDGGK